MLDLKLGAKPEIRHWRIEASWFQEESVEIKYTQAINLFWVENGATVFPLLQQEAFQTTLRGVFVRGEWVQTATVLNVKGQGDKVLTCSDVNGT